jgi:hypothetical protein
VREALASLRIESDRNAASTAALRGEDKDTRKYSETPETARQAGSHWFEPSTAHQEDPKKRRLSFQRVDDGRQVS